MATITTSHKSWAGTTTHHTDKPKLFGKLIAFADAQKKYRTLWFLFSLVFQGVFFLPLPAVLSFYYGAPSYIIAFTLTLFFANVIAGMGGNSIRTMLALFAASVLYHAVVVIMYIF